MNRKDLICEIKSCNEYITGENGRNNVYLMINFFSFIYDGIVLISTYIYFILHKFKLIK